jgi:glycosyltransferase involved in cell wall biosynthesis
MKVCHFTSVHPVDDIRIFHKECVSLAEAGFDVYLVATNGENDIHKGVKVVSTNSKKRGRLGRMVFTSREVYHKALEIDADIYHFHDPELLRFANRLKRKGKIVVYDAHEDLPRQIMAKDWIPLFMRKFVSKYVEWSENLAVKNLSVVVAATPHIENRFRKVTAKTVAICNYPILSEFDYQLNPNRFKNEICYVGGISEMRGIRQLMDALDRLPDVTLNLAGLFANESLKDQITALKAWKRVVKR